MGNKASGPIFTADQPVRELNIDGVSYYTARGNRHLVILGEYHKDVEARRADDGTLRRAGAADATDIVLAAVRPRLQTDLTTFLLLAEDEPPRQHALHGGRRPAGDDEDSDDDNVPFNPVARLGYAAAADNDASEVHSRIGYMVERVRAMQRQAQEQGAAAAVDVVQFDVREQEGLRGVASQNYTSQIAAFADPSTLDAEATPAVRQLYELMVGAAATEAPAVLRAAWRDRLDLGPLVPADNPWHFHIVQTAAHIRHTVDEFAAAYPRHLVEFVRQVDPEVHAAATVGDLIDAVQRSHALRARDLMDLGARFADLYGLSHLAAVPDDTVVVVLCGLAHAVFWEHMVEHPTSPWHLVAASRETARGALFPDAGVTAVRLALRDVSDPSAPTGHSSYYTRFAHTPLETLSPEEQHLLRHRPEALDARAQQFGLTVQQLVSPLT